jgi:uncharacterized protein YndB with AHSA1/START domain
MKQQAVVERKSEQDLVVTRIVDGPAALVFDAWTQPELFQQWWVPKSCGLTLKSCEMDVRGGGGYRLEFQHEAATFTVFGAYTEVAPADQGGRLVWTNDEGEAGVTVTTVRVDACEGGARVTVADRYPSAEALEAAIASGATAGLPESLDQLEEFVRTRSGRA